MIHLENHIKKTQLGGMEYFNDMVTREELQTKLLKIKNNINDVSESESISDILKTNIIDLPLANIVDTSKPITSDKKKKSLLGYVAIGIVALCYLMK